MSYSGARSFYAPTIMDISVARLVKMKQVVAFVATQQGALDKSKKRRFRTAPDNCRSTTHMAFYGPTVAGYLPPAISISSVWAWNQSWSACLLVLSLDS